MCTVWQNKDKGKISYKNLYRRAQKKSFTLAGLYICRRSLFSQLRYIGVLLKVEGDRLTRNKTGLLILHM